MQGILFNYELGMFDAVMLENKTETRRLRIKGRKPRFKVGEIVFLKEPYQLLENMLYYKYGISPFLKCKTYKNKMFMPSIYARYFIEITDVIPEKLGDITKQGAINEGVEYTEQGDGTKIYKNYLYIEKRDIKVFAFSSLRSYKSLWKKRQLRKFLPR